MLNIIYLILITSQNQYKLYAIIKNWVNNSKHGRHVMNDEKVIHINATEY